MNTKYVTGLILVAIGGATVWFYLNDLQFQSAEKQQPSEDDQILTIAEPFGKNPMFGPLYESADKEYGTLIRFLASKLESYGIKEGKFIAVENSYEASLLLRQGKLDIYVDSPFPAYIVAKLTGAEPLVNRWKRGQEKYHSNIFVKKSSAIKTLDDLKGKMMVFDKPDSTSAYFLPKAELIKRGYKMTQKSGPRDSTSLDEIGYYFAGSDVKAMEDMQNGVAAASAQNDADFKTLAGDQAGDYRFIFSTVDVFRHVLVLRPGIDPKLKETIKQILLDMDKDPEGQKVLNDHKKTKKFEEFKPSVAEAFRGIAELSSLVEKEIIGQ
ncbi:phosphate/phosphite/phosphonate ABC transporter substrate-binding protein [Candidatus Giovannonibacteria bacterium]|nr:phosphate/phosphite/phosphonate ABC transporter substrate-binding protein [Candidatus Giovannonibacteria bacterium]